MRPLVPRRSVRRWSTWTFCLQHKVARFPRVLHSVSYILGPLRRQTRRARVTSSRLWSLVCRLRLYLPLKVPVQICRVCHQKTTEHQFVDRQWSRVPRCGLRWSSSQQHSHTVRAVRPTRTKSTFCRQSSIRLHSAHTESILPTTLWGKSPCEVAEESVIRRLQNTISWTGSEAECRDAVCLACSQRRNGESPHVKLQRVSSEDHRTPVCGQAVKQSAVMRSALEFFATGQCHSGSAHLRASRQFSQVSKNRGLVRASRERRNNGLKMFSP